MDDEYEIITPEEAEEYPYVLLDFTKHVLSTMKDIYTELFWYIWYDKNIHYI